ncbi:cytochrome P450 [Colletotrichum graminicola]|uniref:Cytochrome P450 n=1 Tax=Colletotrichum graminicola (strain M1.001 / M2 / FGSC 10212) TaxID=645133 RepID=E3QZV6_COLGM|nr:cytochrome P450 [Colletotrichum graminicola M1.001]EFQ36394.1 cytochrome P450 [Colletotrichum graminicola M1.001]WDK18405.1 cytochrome P450 [Colletotrichum graminicola]
MPSVEWLLLPPVLMPTVVLIIYLVYNYLLFPIPRSIAHLRLLNGEPGEWAPHLRALYRNTLDLKKTLRLHHTQHKNETVRVPILGPGQNKLILLPSAERKWLVDQPDSVVSMHEQTINHFQWDLGTIYPTRDHNKVTIHIIATKLTREIGNLIPALSNELDLALAQHWGDEGSTEWREVGVYDTLRPIVSQAINRIFIGKRHCRNGKLLDTGFSYAKVIPLEANLLWLLPAPLRRLLAPLMTLPSRWCERKWFKLTIDEVHRRLEARGHSQYSKGSGTKDWKHDGEEDEADLLSWYIAHGESQGDPYLLDPEVLSARILLLNAFALHTNVFAIVHMILDIVGSGAEQGSKMVAQLRQEINEVRAAHGEEQGWNKGSLAQLERLDSSFRESQRVNTILSLGPLRIVGKDGVTTPSGVHIPQGYQVGIPAYSIHFDTDIYGPDAETFKPFRFYDRRKDARGTGDNLKGARQAWATTSADYLSFGAGLNSCPGRFFASGMLKVLMANILLKYEFEFKDKRPENLWFGTNHIPPLKEKIRIRRRSAL